MKRLRTMLGGGQAAALALLLALQALAAVFFVGDVVADLTFDGFDAHLLLEATVSAALVLGVVFGAREMRRTLECARRSEAALSAARGALGELIEARFEDWRLTRAEREVALLALKGFDIAGIAALRCAAHGTVRAQLARVYAKSGVSSRAELVSLFVDDLLAEPLALQGHFARRPQVPAVPSWEPDPSPASDGAPPGNCRRGAT